MRRPLPRSLRTALDHAPARRQLAHEVAKEVARDKRQENSRASDPYFAEEHAGLGADGGACASPRNDDTHPQRERCHRHHHLQQLDL